MIRISDIRDDVHGVYAATGPCSMATPCPGDSCPTHGRRPPVVAVTPQVWQVAADDRYVGLVSLTIDGTYQIGHLRAGGREYPTLSEAVAALTP